MKRVCLEDIGHNKQLSKSNLPKNIFFLSCLRCSNTSGTPSITLSPLQITPSQSNIKTSLLSISLEGWVSFSGTLSIFNPLLNATLRNEVFTLVNEATGSNKENIAKILKIEQLRIRSMAVGISSIRFQSREFLIYNLSIVLTR